MKPARDYKRGSLEARFWRYVDKRGPDECWPWLAAREVWDGGGSYETPIRLAWKVQQGPIPDGHTVISRCRPAICVNAAHLSTGPNGAHQTLAGELGKAIKGEQASWAKLTEEKVVQIRREAHGWDDVEMFARQFNVSPACVYKALTRKSWQHVA